MSTWLSWTVTAIYALVCVEQLIKGNHPMAIAYAGWASANAALIFTLK